MREKSKDNELEQVSHMLEKCDFKAMKMALSALDTTGELYEMNPLHVLKYVVSEEYAARMNKLSRNRKQHAHLYISEADSRNIYYDQNRHLNKELIDRLITNDYIDAHRSIMINAATGCGKTYMACVFGNRACEEGYTVSYYTMSDLFYEYRTVLRKDTDIKKYISKKGNVDLLIIDDFMLTSATIEEAEFLYEVLNAKRPHNRKRSYILCSQLMSEEIYNRLAESSKSLADAVMDRIIHGAYKIHIEGDSMRAREVELDEEEARTLNLDEEI